MPFEKFTKHGETFNPRVSIWTNGNLGISAGAFNVYELTDKIFVTLFYDKEHRRVGLKFSNRPDEPGAVRMTVRKSGGTIPCTTFFKHWRIDYSMVRNYVLSWSEPEGIFVFDLDLPIDDDDCPEHPHAMFVESVYAGLETFLAQHPHPKLSLKARGLLARTLFAMAAHHHLNPQQITHLLESAVEPATAENDRRTLKLHKLLACGREKP